MQCKAYTVAETIFYVSKGISQVICISNPMKFILDKRERGKSYKLQVNNENSGNVWRCSCKFTSFFLFSKITFHSQIDNCKLLDCFESGCPSGKGGLPHGHFIDFFPFEEFMVILRIPRTF